MWFGNVNGYCLWNRVSQSENPDSDNKNGEVRNLAYVLKKVRFGTAPINKFSIYHHPAASAVLLVLLLPGALR